MRGAGVRCIALSGRSRKPPQTTLTIESWRNDDADIWNNQIIPAFKAAHPDIDVVFKPTRADRIQRRA